MKVKFSFKTIKRKRAQSNVALSCVLGGFLLKASLVLFQDHSRHLCSALCLEKNLLPT